MSGVRIGVDTGGTFTDLMALDSAGRLQVMKVPSTPDDDTRAFLEGLAGLCETGGFAPADDNEADALAILDWALANGLGGGGR